MQSTNLHKSAYFSAGLILAGIVIFAPLFKAAVADQEVQAGQIFRDCTHCPEMIIIPAGKFLMGSSAADTRRDMDDMPSDESEADKRTFTSEHPQHEVTIARPFALGRYFVTRGEFAAFTRETGYAASGGCVVYSNHRYPLRPEAGWQAPGFEQTDHDPVVCVNWHDIQAYLGWLNKKLSGQAVVGNAGPYRLPSEAEWEYAARGGTVTVRWWGDSIGKDNADCEGCGSRWDDRQPAPIGSFQPNPFGIFEILGSAWELTEDCWNKNYLGAPADGSAWRDGGWCLEYHSMRGGSFASRPWLLRPAKRTFHSSDERANYIGFRVAKTVE